MRCVVLETCSAAWPTKRVQVTHQKRTQSQYLCLRTFTKFNTFKKTFAFLHGHAFLIPNTNTKTLYFSSSISPLCTLSHITQVERIRDRFNFGDFLLFHINDVYGLWVWAPAKGTGGKAKHAFSHFAFDDD